MITIGGETGFALPVRDVAALFRAVRAVDSCLKLSE